jgi:hypothetical protein
LIRNIGTVTHFGSIDGMFYASLQRGLRLLSEDMHYNQR